MIGISALEREIKAGAWTLLSGGLWIWAWGWVWWAWFCGYEHRDECDEHGFVDMSMWMSVMSMVLWIWA